MITAHSLRVPRWFGFSHVEVALDEITDVGGGFAVTSGEGRLGLSERATRELRAALEVPGLEGGFDAQASAFGARFLAPHASRRMAKRLLDAAAHLGASDLHLEPGEGGATVRLRVTGELRAFCEVPKAAAQRLTAAWKGLAGCLPYRTDVLQEGRIGREGVGADVRASFLPTALGERVALRLFGRLFSLPELGLEDPLRERLERVLTAKSGLLVVAGSTGAGKTTTLYALLSHLAKQRGGAHLSVEDPVEQRLRLAGVPCDQVELEPARGITAEAVLAASLRQDVDVISVGEIRTAAEARLALEAAHTGRLVLAGLHAGSAAEAKRRLLDLGAEPAVLDATLRAVLHQELSTVACPAGPCDRCRGLGRTRAVSATLEVSE